MSTATFTKEELKAYIESLNIDENNKSKLAISAIQLLDPPLMLRLFTHLINRTVSIEQLYNTPLSNTSVSHLLDGLDSTTDPLARAYQFYKDLLNNLGTYQSFITRLKENSFTRMKVVMLSASRLSLKIEIDPLGLDPTLPTSITDIRKQYKEFFNDSIFNPLTDRINTSINYLRETYGIDTTFIDAYFYTSIHNMGLLYTDDGSVPKLFTNNSVIGWIRRKTYLDAIYSQHTVHREKILSLMASNYDNDTLKLGVSALLNEFNPVEDFKALLENTSLINNGGFIEEFEYLSCKYYTFLVLIYGEGYVEADKLALVVDLYDAIINHFRIYSDYINTAMGLAYENFTRK